MKLRTVLRELMVTDYVTGPDVLLNKEVIVYPASSLELSFPEQLVLAPAGETAPPGDFEGVMLVYEGHALSDRNCRPACCTIRIASEYDRATLENVFLHLPELHVHLDLQRKRLYEAFQSSYDIQSFADRSYEILGNPLLIVNSDRRLLATSGNFPENRADVLEEIREGYLSEEINEEMERAGIIDDVRHAGHSIITPNERFGQRWVTSIITYHYMEMGRFDMLELDKVIRDSDLELVDFAGSLAGVLIDKLGIAGERAGSGSTVLDDLLGATFANEKTMRTQLALSSMPLDETYVLVTISGERDIPRSHLQRVAAQVSNAFQNNLWTIHEERLAFLIALGVRKCAGWDGYERAARILGQNGEFVDILERNGLRAYACEPFEHIGLAPDRYGQVINLIDARVKGTDRIVYFWHHRYAVLASISRTFNDMDMMLDKRVVCMSLYDQDHGTSYLQTAYETVRNPGSPAEAARALNVHRNTYFYRVNKILELFFLDLRNGDDRLSVSFFAQYLEGIDNVLLSDVDELPTAWRRVVGH